MSPYYVYIYYIKDTILYIGKATENPYTRYLDHIKTSTRNHAFWYIKYIDKVAIIPLKNKTDMEVAELYLIMKYKPIMNTREICLHIEPTLIVNRIPKPETYSMQEFFNTFGYGHKKRSLEELSEDEFKEYYNIDLEERERLYQIKHESKSEKQERYRKEWDNPEYNIFDNSSCITLYYRNNELMAISSDAHDWHRRSYHLLLEEYIQSNADFSSIDRISQIIAPTSIEAKIIEKYLISKKHPLWNSTGKYFRKESNLIIYHIPKEKAFPKKNYKRELEFFTKEINIFKDKKKAKRD